MSTSAYQTHAKFETTQWPLIDGTRAENPEQRAAALNALAERYWPPIYATLRGMKYPPDEAAEITQSFFADVVLPRNLFARADGNRGRLRTLLQHALDNHLVDRHRHAAARGAGKVLSLHGLEHEERLLAASRELAPALVFEQRWALALLEEALRRCEAHFRQSGRPGHWAVFEARHLRPALSPTNGPALRPTAHEHGFRESPDASSALQVVRKRLVELIHDVIAETTPDPADQPAELNLIWRLKK